ncbi:thiamine-binding protein [Clostridium sp. D2Q-14]|uniref:YkoF family thiamine/hydroxymethylpyrimidine-binding protein n=1 Tax=Anaeromonas gelatinilytica TaxID=2683194 RepID=UPI00193B870E|nr:YkoF family thiamine/hydroxymethylpyrimidine-binding protein [Anaeromonas gelatinilytica]MBS4534314.1 thiamine-binding protein [Anaeromonas gelatinilytica]
MEKIASCEISFIPINSGQYLKDIDRVLDIIRDSKLEYNIDILSTTIRGNKNKVLNLISTIYNDLDSQCDFTMDIKISNICGCKG